MKKLGKLIIVRILQGQVRRLVAKNPQLKVVGVAGSIGKTSTKLAVAEILSQKYRVQHQKGNYNDAVTVPLIFFGIKNPPALTNPISWVKILLSNNRAINKPYPYDVVVLELGTDGVGQIPAFGEYLRLDVGVLTAISMEHMEYFADLDEVAKEESAIQDYSKIFLSNSDLTAPYIKGVDTTYGLKSGGYTYKKLKQVKNGFSFAIYKKSKKLLETRYSGISDAELYSVLAAAAVASELGLSESQIKKGIASIRPFAGRMQVLEGLNGSTIIDDSYNSSPEAVKSALEMLYKQDALQRIALLGNMNELGDFSRQAHMEVGGLCDPKKLDLVVTLGHDANNFLANQAKAKGCKVVTTRNPIQAGEIILQFLKPGAVVLIKGSQNGVFAEEAIKPLLKNRTDASKLVRQEESWMSFKAEQFNL
jgi:UDP-N-acetylmuramoyl-tripeptide--D-alanyl-D-alanine ligase